MAVKTVIADGFTNLRPLVDTIAREGIPAEAADIYQGRNRVVRYDASDQPLNIKEFHVPNAINRLVYGNLRKSKARRAFENGQRLLEMGFDTPRPIAFIEKTDGRLMGQSYYISRQEDGMEDIRRLARSPLRDRLVDHIGQLMAQLHQAGVWMKDFSQGNILWRLEPDGSLRLTLVDINRMAFNVTSRRKLMSNFRTVTDDPQMLRAIAAAYAFHAGADPDQVLRQAIDQRRRYKRKARLKAKLRH